MQIHAARAKKPCSHSFLSKSCRTDFLLDCLGMSPKLATAQLPNVRVFQRWRLKTTGQVSPVQFSCTKKLWDEARGQPVLSCLSKRLCHLISKSISCMIDLKIKQIRKQSIYHERYGISSLCFQDLSHRKTLEVAGLTTVSQFGINFKIMFLVVRYQDHWLRSSFKKENPFPANEAYFVHIKAQIKCYLKHEHTKCSCVAEWWLKALQR